MVFRTDSLPLMDDIALANDVDMQLGSGETVHPLPTQALSVPKIPVAAQNGEMMRLRVQCCAYACNAARVQRSLPPRRSPNRRRARTKKWRLPRRPRVSPRRRFLSLRRGFPFFEILGTVRRCMASPVWLAVEAKCTRMPRRPHMQSCAQADRCCSKVRAHLQEWQEARHKPSLQATLQRVRRSATH
jgi:hypothetical protein